MNAVKPPAPAPIETLGRELGLMIDSLGVPQVDLVMYSMGSQIGRSYLAGKQIDPGVFKPPIDPKVRKAVFIGGPHFGDETLGDQPGFAVLPGYGHGSAGIFMSLRRQP